MDLSHSAQELVLVGVLICIFVYSLLTKAIGSVAQIGLRSHSPLPRTDLAYGHGIGYAESSEAI